MNALAVIAMSPNNQLLGCLVMGIGIGILLTRSYDQVRHELAMRRRGRRSVPLKPTPRGFTIDLTDLHGNRVPATRSFKPNIETIFRRGVNPDGEHREDVKSPSLLDPPNDYGYRDRP